MWWLVLPHQYPFGCISWVISNTRSDERQLSLSRTTSMTLASWKDGQCPIPAQEEVTVREAAWIGFSHLTIRRRSWVGRDVDQMGDLESGEAHSLLFVAKPPRWKQRRPEIQGFLCAEP